jgi:hypothetical protein
MDSAIAQALADAKQSHSRLSDRAPGSEAVMKMTGMTGCQTRHLYNGLVTRLAQCCGHTPLKYLEVGTWGGSSLVGSLYGNEAVVDAVVIDNWSEFNHMLTPICMPDGSKIDATPRECFRHNRQTFLSSLPDERLHIIEHNCFEVAEVPLAGGADLYIYDGPHELTDHEKAITNFENMLADKAVIVIDDWNWQTVREGTWKGLAFSGLRVRYFAEVFTPGRRNLDAAGFWNGVAVFSVERVKARHPHKAKHRSTRVRGGAHERDPSPP